MSPYDYVLVGGGLQNGLVALALAAARPDARVILLERGGRLGGNHTWSFHAGDVPPAIAAAIAPLVVARWPGYDVAFPSLARTVDEPYASISSARLDEVVRDRLGGAVRLGAVVDEVGPGEVRLAGGETLRGAVIIDARGPAAAAPDPGVGWQKFVGLELALARPTALTRPILMDARVEQLGGFRFVYTLPLAPDRLLVEDTVYADDPALDEDAFAARALAYAERLGASIARVVRREHGVLAIPWRPEEPAPLAGAPGAYLLRGGYGGGWFHPTTGYSLPCAARLAAHVAGRAPDALADGFDALRARHRRQAGFARLLSRLLFRNFAPEDRRNVLERFHRLPAATIRRFYALESTTGDRARILCGRPPRGMTLRRPGVAPEVS